MAGAYPDLEDGAAPPKAVLTASVFSVKALILGQDRGQGLQLPIDWKSEGEPSCSSPSQTGWPHAVPAPSCTSGPPRTRTETEGAAVAEVPRAAMCYFTKLNAYLLSKHAISENFTISPALDLKATALCHAVNVYNVNVATFYCGDVHQASGLLSICAQNTLSEGTAPALARVVTRVYPAGTQGSRY